MYSFSDHGRPIVASVWILCGAFFHQLGDFFFIVAPLPCIDHYDRFEDDQLEMIIVSV